METAVGKYSRKIDTFDEVGEDGASVAKLHHFRRDFRPIDIQVLCRGGL